MPFPSEEFTRLNKIRLAYNEAEEKASAYQQDIGSEIRRLHEKIDELKGEQQNATKPAEEFFLELVNNLAAGQIWGDVIGKRHLIISINQTTTDITDADIEYLFKKGDEFKVEEINILDFAEGYACTFEGYIDLN